VTGGRGFTRSHLVERLVAAGAAVAVLGDLSRGRRAWLAPEAEPDPARSLNVDGMRNLLEALQRRPPRCFCSPRLPPSTPTALARSTRAALRHLPISTERPSSKGSGSLQTSRRRPGRSTSSHASSTSWAGERPIHTSSPSSSSSFAAGARPCSWQSGLETRLDRRPRRRRGTAGAALGQDERGLDLQRRLGAIGLRRRGRAPVRGTPRPPNRRREHAAAPPLTGPPSSSPTRGCCTRPPAGSRATRFARRSPNC
jgi:hypothetical protein